MRPHFLLLQRLYSVPSLLRLELPFGNNPDFTLDDIYSHPMGHTGLSGQTSSIRTPTSTLASTPVSSAEGGIMSRSGGFSTNHHVCHTPTSTSCHSHCGCCHSCCGGDRTVSGTSSSGGGSGVGVVRIRRNSITKSRIPRPISLPKRLETKLNGNISLGGCNIT